MTRISVGVALLVLAGRALGADVPPASAEFRAQIMKEYVGLCVKGIEDQPDLKAMYSQKTVEVYCVCRQRYRADVLAQAIKNGERGKAVTDKAHNYSQAKCGHILVNGLEKE